MKLAPDPQVDSCKTRSFQTVAAQRAGPVRRWISVAVDVGTGEHVVEPAALQCDQRAETEVVQPANSARNLTHHCQSEPVRYALSRYGTLQVSILPLREVGKVSHGLAIVY